MFEKILLIHTVTRWILLLSLTISCVWSGYLAYIGKKGFSRYLDKLRFWVVTFAHAQVIFGMALLSESPIARYFWSRKHTDIPQLETQFYGWIHGLTMLLAVICMTIGSAKVKYTKESIRKPIIMSGWFTLALILIVVAIPWPFSPFSHRPVWRWGN